MTPVQPNQYISYQSHYSVPDLKLDVLIVHSDGSGAELHSDGQVMGRFEPLVCELKEQTGFADAYISVIMHGLTRIADNYELKNVGVRLERHY